jgi:hypothetical protein
MSNKDLPMESAAIAHHEALRREWTDQFVRVKPESPELRRFAGVIGRVITVNWNNKAVVDFQDGGWYDITASEDFLTKINQEEGRKAFDFKVNSAQPVPERQG